MVVNGGVDTLNRYSSFIGTGGKEELKQLLNARWQATYLTNVGSAQIFSDILSAIDFDAVENLGDDTLYHLAQALNELGNG